MLLRRFFLTSFLLVVLAAVASATPPPKKKVMKKKPVAPHSRYTFGMSIVSSQQKQSKRELQTTPENTYQISEFSGQSFFFRFFVDVPFDKTWAGRVAVVMRKTDMKGNAELDGSPEPTKLHLQQQFIGIEALVKHYFHDQWWFGGGIEFSKGTQVQLTSVSGAPIDASGLKKPFFTVLAGSLGWDYQFKSVIINPEFKVGVVATTDPVTYLIEEVVNIGYVF